MQKTLEKIVAKKHNVTSPYNVREVFQQVFKTLQSRHKLIEMDIEALSLVGTDEDHHRRRSGYMIYRKALIYRTDKKCYIIAFSEATDGSPASVYSYDLKAIMLTGELPGDSKELKDLIARQIKSSGYFYNSIMTGFAHKQCIGFHDEKILNQLKKKLGSASYVTHTEQPDPFLIGFDAITMNYSSQFVEKLTSTIETYLAKD